MGRGSRRGSDGGKGEGAADFKEQRRAVEGQEE